MNTPFAQLYLDLSNHLKNTVPALQWIDQDFGQLERFKYRPEVAFPCALIDMPNARFSNLAGLSQVGEMNLIIRLGFAPFSQSHQAAPMHVKELALSYYETEQQVYLAVQGWHNAYVQPLIRVSTATEMRDDEEGLRVRVLTFATAFEDTSAQVVYTKQTAKLVIDATA